MINLILVVLLELVLVGCEHNKVNDTTIKGITKECIEGHVYYQTTRGSIAPKLTDDGKPVSCRNEIEDW